MRRAVRVLVLPFLLIATATFAHNAELAVAVPLRDIRIDGDLSDWPEEMRRYPVGRREAGAVVEDDADLLAWFRVGWDREGGTLYVAVEALDSSPVVVDTATAWNASDGCEVFLDLPHRPLRSPCVQHVLYGDHRQVFADGTGGSLEHSRHAVDRRGGRHRYEWAFDIGSMAAAERRLEEGVAIGLDIAVADRDEDGSFSWVAWGPGVGKLGATPRRGDVALVGEDGAAELWGHVRWRGEQQGRPPRRVRIEGRAPERLWVQVGVDDHGRYQASLPVGKYRLQPVDVRILRDRETSVQVKTRLEQRTQAPDLIVVPEEERSVLVDQLFADSPPSAPGAAVLVARDGRVLHAAGYGLADVEHGAPITPQTKFRIASVSKQFTATAVMLLAEDGLVDIDAPLSTYLPDYPHAAEVTARQLMSHTSGIQNYLSLPAFWETAALGRDMAGLLDVFQHMDLAFAPGTRYSYSNSGYVVLAHLVEQLTGQAFGEFLQARMFEPLGMTDTGVDHYRPILSRRAQGYSISAEGELVNTSWLDMYLLTGAGNLYSTVEDLLKWDQALYGDGLLAPATRQEMLTKTRLADGNEIAYGLGWRLGQVQGLSEIAHSGSINGFTSRLSRYPDQRFTVIVLVNNPRLPAGTLAAQVAEIYLSSEMSWRTAETP
jgi:CubicO group peptidase (beta-lactamase class C family)